MVFRLKTIQMVAYMQANQDHKSFWRTIQYSIQEIYDQQAWIILENKTEKKMKPQTGKQLVEAAEAARLYSIYYATLNISRKKPGEMDVMEIRRIVKYYKNR